MKNGKKHGSSSDNTKLTSLTFLNEHSSLTTKMKHTSSYMKCTLLLRVRTNQTRSKSHYLICLGGNKMGSVRRGHNNNSFSPRVQTISYSLKQLGPFSRNLTKHSWYLKVNLWPHTNHRELFVFGKNKTERIIQKEYNRRREKKKLARK